MYIIILHFDRWERYLQKKVIILFWFRMTDQVKTLDIEMDFPWQHIAVCRPKPVLLLNRRILVLQVAPHAQNSNTS